MPNTGTITALVLDPADTVATVLADVEAGGVIVLKGKEGKITAMEKVCFGHKIALQEMGKGEAIVKYGQEIGSAITAVHPGEWVHLHNMASALDTGFKKRIS